MSRVFRRGQLKLALLHVVQEIGPATGYTLMHHLADVVGEGWRPSPGAVYPALLALEDAGLVDGTEVHGNREYTITASGLEQVSAEPDLLDEVVRQAPPMAGPSLGSLLDDFARSAPGRSRRLTADEARQIDDVLAAARADLTDRLSPRRTS